MTFKHKSPLGCLCLKLTVNESKPHRGGYRNLRITPRSQALPLALLINIPNLLEPRFYLEKNDII